MERKDYIAPTLQTDFVSQEQILAMSFDTTSAEWKDDVELDTKANEDWEIWQ